MHSLIRLCEMAWAQATHELKPDANCLRVAVHCGGLLGVAIETDQMPGELAGLDLQLNAMHGLLAALRTMLWFHQRRAAPLASVDCHLSSIASALLRLSGEVHTRWQQPSGDGGDCGSVLLRQQHGRLACPREQALLGGLHVAAWDALRVGPTNAADPGDLEQIHGAAAKIIYRLLSEYISEPGTPPQLMRSYDGAAGGQLKLFDGKEGPPYFTSCPLT